MRFFFLLFLFISFPVLAQESNEGKAEQVPVKIVMPEFDDLKHTKSGRVDKVIDGLTILLKDKTIIRLASLDIPDFHVWRDAPHSDAALTLLQEYLPEGTEIMMYQTLKAKKGRLNRMNHELAHIVTKSVKNHKEEREAIWINGLLLGHGIARVMVAPNATELIEPMLSTEKSARGHKRGIWADDSDYNIMTPENAENAIGEFAIIEGRIEKAASVRNNIYLNFGKDWKTDFTIMLTPALRKKLAQRGIHGLSLGGETVRVRGWLREYNGPLIELDTPEHLEIINKDKNQES